ncbi:MAG: hypothetical protein J1E58_00235 [Prevotella sp.]|nr:hypothetical protein [Prevotella sp.]
MKKYILFVLLFMLFSFSAFSQTTIEEPEYIGEALLVTDSNTGVLLDKEYGELKSSVSLKKNSWNVLKLYISGEKASCRAKSGEVKIIVRANDNNSDPMSLITIYKMNAKKKQRSVDLSVDHSDNPFASSKTYSKDKMKFQGKKYGSNSYIITTNLEAGEYGIIIRNPNNVDEKSCIVSCIGIE